MLRCDKSLTTVKTQEYYCLSLINEGFLFCHERKFDLFYTICFWQIYAGHYSSLCFVLGAYQSLIVCSSIFPGIEVKLNNL